MRRSLVLTTESARHPFRRSLPPHVLFVPKDEPEVARRDGRAGDEDWKLFALSFCAFFTAFYSFIA